SVDKVHSAAILTLSLSFNNDGPLGSFFRYICDNGTYKAFYDDLSDGKDKKIDVSKVDVSMDGIELEDREFIAAIKEKREPNASLVQLLPCMRVLGRLEQIIDPQRKAHAYPCHWAAITKRRKTHAAKNSDDRDRAAGCTRDRAGPCSGSREDRGGASAHRRAGGGRRADPGCDEAVHGEERNDSR